MDKENTSLLLYTEIRWLSRSRVFELKDEMHAQFQQNDKKDFTKCFEDQMWVQMLVHNIFINDY